MRGRTLGAQPLINKCCRKYIHTLWQCKDILTKFIIVYHGCNYTCFLYTLLYINFLSGFKPKYQLELCVLVSQARLSWGEERESGLREHCFTAYDWPNVTTTCFQGKGEAPSTLPTDKTLAIGTVIKPVGVHSLWYTTIIILSLRLPMHLWSGYSLHCLICCSLWHNLYISLQLNMSPIYTWLCLLWHYIIQNIAVSHPTEYAPI